MHRNAAYCLRQYGVGASPISLPLNTAPGRRLFRYRSIRRRDGYVLTALRAYAFCAAYVLTALRAYGCAAWHQSIPS